MGAHRPAYGAAIKREMDRPTRGAYVDGDAGAYVCRPAEDGQARALTDRGGVRARNLPIGGCDQLARDMHRRQVRLLPRSRCRRGRAWFDGWSGDGRQSADEADRTPQGSTL